MVQLNEGETYVISFIGKKPSKTSHYTRAQIKKYSMTNMSMWKTYSGKLRVHFLIDKINDVLIYEFKMKRQIYPVSQANE